MPAVIIEIEENSIADEIGIEAGDILLSIDDKEIHDILDYQFMSREESLIVDIQKADGKIWSIEIEKDYHEDLGLVFEDIVFDKMKVCKNRCIFCFIDQLPRKMRKTLYEKDDDYRHSFLFGNFITLTNLSEYDWEKILSMRLSPLYISVHALQPEIRSLMLGSRQAVSIREDLLRLSQAGIESHTQIVVCPGINDGKILEDTIEGLAELYPSVASIGIVPIGLTGHRQNLPELRNISSSEADQLISVTNRYQQKFRQDLGYGLVYLADEIYLKANLPLPETDYYDDFPQIENGIGICRILMDEFAEEEDLLPAKVDQREIFLLTGESALDILGELSARMNLIEGLKLEIIPVKNYFFGGQVTVTGLLTGVDIIAALGDKYAGKEILIPDILLKEGKDTLLDDMKLKDIKEASGADIKVIPATARSMINAVLGK
ncbi:fe-s oxidoreductase [hydrocarbon metagenome]|uniref:Fe-s oxidoreductase n=1 Tax=hydrocarbon metagenome TaxID=938273 RepID=A0A0W8E7R1_9ZZZZ